MSLSSPAADNNSRVDYRRSRPEFSSFILTSMQIVERRIHSSLKPQPVAYARNSTVSDHTPTLSKRTLCDNSKLHRTLQSTFESPYPVSQPRHMLNNLLKLRDSRESWQIQSQCSATLNVNRQGHVRHQSLITFKRHTHSYRVITSISELYTVSQKTTLM